MLQDRETSYRKTTGGLTVADQYLGTHEDKHGLFEVWRCRVEDPRGTWHLRVVEISRALDKERSIVSRWKLAHDLYGNLGE